MPSFKQEKRTLGGKLIVSMWPTEGSRKTIISPNWCDPTTWFYNSIRVENETAVAVASGTSYQLSKKNVIDVCHGKITGEDSLKDNEGLSYTVSVTTTVSGVETAATEVDIHTGVGDFTLDYNAGLLTFNPPIDENAEVKVSYNYENGSLFVFGPTSGKTLEIKDVEVQFSSDIEITDSILFQPHGYVDVFAPQLLISNGGPYPPGTKIPIATTVYKTMMDYINDANGALPQIPALGGPGWRGMSCAVYVFPWRYQAMTALKASLGLEVHIKLAHEIPFIGELATATFYCLSENENQY